MMIANRLVSTLVCIAGCVALFPSAPAVAAESGVIGRWNLTVSQPPHKEPSWLAVEQKEGKLMGRFLGGAGSVGDIGEVKFSDDTIEFKAHDRVWTGKLKGDSLIGTWKRGDAEGAWVGERSICKPDVRGEWKLTFPNGDPATLTIEQTGDKLAGKWARGDRNADLTRAELNGTAFAFAFGRRQVTAEVKGDVMTGTLGRNQFSGQRQRKWGKPIELFNGKDLDNWKPLGDGKQFHWQIVDGIMTNGSQHTENIITKDSKFRDFKLHVEFKVPEGGNSGVYLRGRHEVQIEDSHGKQPDVHGCGGLYSRIAPSVNASKPAGEWQTFDITLIGPFLTVVQNDKTIIDNQEMEGITGGAIDSKEGEPGPIYLQGDHSQIFYRKVTLTPAE